MTIFRNSVHNPKIIDNPVPKCILSEFRITFAITAEIKQKSPPDAPTSLEFGVTIRAVNDPTTTPTLYKTQIRNVPWTYSRGDPIRICIIIFPIKC